MKNSSRKTKLCKGFSLVEMLVVVAIISILIALLLPAFGAVQKMALNLRQKAQFNAIEIGLEAFSNDFSDYPESSYADGYGGAQKLAEAMMGMDGMGVHKDTDFNADAEDDSGNLLYNIGTTGKTLTGTDLEESLAKRYGPYLETDTANAVYLNDIDFPSSDAGTCDMLLAERTLVLADQYGTVKNSLTNKKTGMPVLYFKAGTHISGDTEYVFNFQDNWYFAGFDGSVGKDGSKHDWLTGNPYEEIHSNFRDYNFASYKPHRSESFILMSAGIDGFYGTSDDVYNFEANK